MLPEISARHDACSAILKNYGHLLEPKRFPAIDAILRKSQEFEARGPSPAIQHILKTYGKPEDPLLKGGDDWDETKHPRNPDGTFRSGYQVVFSKRIPLVGRTAAINSVLRAHENGNKPVRMGGRDYYVSTRSLNKMTAEHGQGGVKKPYQRERIVAIQSIDELADRAVVNYRDDQLDDRDVDVIAEGRVMFRYGGVDYLVRLLGKVWKASTGKKDKLHSLAIEDVILERPGADQLFPDAGSSLHGEAGIDRLGKSGNRLSASTALSSTIPNPGDKATKSFDDRFDLLKSHIAAATRGHHA